MKIMFIQRYKGKTVLKLENILAANLCDEVHKPATVYISFSVRGSTPYQWYLHFEDDFLASEFLASLQEISEKRAIENSKMSGYRRDRSPTM